MYMKNKLLKIPMMLNQFSEKVLPLNSLAEILRLFNDYEQAKKYYALALSLDK